MKIKKLTAILIAAGMCLNVCACGGKTSDVSEKNTGTEIVETSDTPDASVDGDSVAESEQESEEDINNSEVGTETESKTDITADAENADESETEEIESKEEVTDENSDATNEEVSVDVAVSDKTDEESVQNESADAQPATEISKDELSAESTEEAADDTTEATVDDSTDITAEDATETAESENETALAAAEPVVLDNISYSQEQMEQIYQFYDGSVFAGDSVLLGFRNFSARSDDPLSSRLQFLAAGSLSLHNAFWPVSEKSVHPLYQGEQHQIWESLQLMNAQKVFLFFGINDVSYGVEESVPLYQQLVDKIKEYCPNIDVTIISATYTLKDMGKGQLNNSNIAAFNAATADLAAQNGWGYIDLASVLSDGAGNLAPQYCSDGFLHESNAAYKVWNQMLIHYAAGRLGIQGTPVE